MRKLRTVVEKWYDSLPYKNGNLRTDGQSIYSYHLEIARKYNDCFYVLDEKSSKTTNNHINLIIQCLKQNNKTWFKLVN